MLEKINQKLKNKKRKSFKYIFKKYRLYFIASFIVFFIFIIYLLFKPVLFKSWLNYPLDLRAEIAFEYFKESFNDDCFSTCLLEREKMAHIIIKAWQENEDIWQKKIFQYLFESNNTQEKRALINMSLYIYNNNEVPLFLENIIYDKRISYQTRHHIIRAYESSFYDNNELYLHLISQALNQEIEMAKRQSALLSTRAWNNKENIDLSFIILKSHEDYEIKKTAIDLINSWSTSDIKISQDELLLISDLISNEDYYDDLRVELIWLLSEYYSLYPEIVSDSLRLVYNNENLDNISRGFSAQALNFLNADNLKIPDISQEEWNTYYNY